jgi:hypothetical protein
MSATKVALLCDGNPGFGKAVKTLYLSRTTGREDAYAGTMSQWAIQAELTASPAGNLAVATWSIGSFIDINDTKGGTTWHQVIASGDGGAGVQRHQLREQQGGMGRGQPGKHVPRIWPTAQEPGCGATLALRQVLTRADVVSARPAARRPAGAATHDRLEGR